MFAEGDFLEFADAGAGDFGEGDEGTLCLRRAVTEPTLPLVGSAVCSRR